jgi:hypothetical protein
MDYDGSEDTGGSVESLRVLVEKEGRSIINHMELAGYHVSSNAAHPRMVGGVWFLKVFSLIARRPEGKKHNSVAVFYTPNQEWGIWETTELHHSMTAEEVLEKAKNTLRLYERGENPWT